MVKKSDGARNRSTVSKRMWSASTWYGRVQPSSRTAASAAARTPAGSEPTVTCSRCDLFQTGTTSAPWTVASRNARNCAFAWWAKRSPTPTEYLASVNMRDRRGMATKKHKEAQKEEQVEEPFLASPRHVFLLVFFRAFLWPFLPLLLLQFGLDRLGQFLRLRRDLQLVAADDFAVA